MRRTLVGAAVVLATALGMPMVTASAAGAVTSTTNCTSSLAPGTYGMVVVPPGAACLIQSGPINIRNGLFVQQGATFVLGDEEHPGNNGLILGGVHGTNPASVQIHFTSILNGLDIQGGAGPLGGPFSITWNAIEDNIIVGPVTVNGYNGFWFGFIRNRSNGGVTMTNNVLADSDGNEYVSNLINGNLACFNNSPSPQVGDSEGLPNIVSGARLGQCASL